MEDVHLYLWNKFETSCPCKLCDKINALEEEMSDYAWCMKSSNEIDVLIKYTNAIIHLNNITSS